MADTVGLVFLGSCSRGAFSCLRVGHLGQVDTSTLRLVAQSRPALIYFREIDAYPFSVFGEPLNMFVLNDSRLKNRSERRTFTLVRRNALAASNLD